MLYAVDGSQCFHSSTSPSVLVQLSAYPNWGHNAGSTLTMYKYIAASMAVDSCPENISTILNPKIEKQQGTNRVDRKVREHFGN